MFKLLTALVASTEAHKLKGYNKYDYNDHYTYVGPMHMEYGLHVNEDALHSEMDKFSRTLNDYHYDNANQILSALNRSGTYDGGLPEVNTYEAFDNGMTWPHYNGRF